MYSALRKPAKAKWMPLLYVLYGEEPALVLKLLTRIWSDLKTSSTCGQTAWRLTQHNWYGCFTDVQTDIWYRHDAACLYTKHALFPVITYFSRTDVKRSTFNCSSITLHYLCSFHFTSIRTTFGFNHSGCGCLADGSPLLDPIFWVINPRFMISTLSCLFRIWEPVLQIVVQQRDTQMRVYIWVEQGARCCYMGGRSDGF